MPGEGEVRGIAASLNEWFTRFTAVTLRSRVPRDCIPTLGIVDWHLYAWHEQGTTPSVAIGSATPVDIFTVPADQRAYLVWVWAERASGDNTIRGYEMGTPAGYGNADANVSFLRLTTAVVANAYWPNRSSVVDYDIPPGGPHLLLEPGTALRLIPAGVGAAASTFNYRILLRRSKLTRSRAP